MSHCAYDLPWLMKKVWQNLHIRWQNLTISNLATTANMVLIPLNIQQQPSSTAYVRFPFANQLLTKIVGTSILCMVYQRRGTKKRDIVRRGNYGTVKMMG